MPSRFRVPLGYLAGVLVFVLAHPSVQSVALGVLLAVPGELLRLWASGHIDKTRALATGGPYAHTRNPLYVGSTLMMLGAAVGAGSVLAALVLALYIVACYPAVIREEAGFLRKTFPEYEGWAHEVPLFLPQPIPRGPRATRFSWSRVMKNREWEAAFALPGMVLLFYLRHLLP